MSYDFLIFKLNTANPRVDLLTAENCVPFGPPEEVRRLLAREVPGLRWGPDDRGTIGTSDQLGFYTEFIVADREPLYSIGVLGSTEPAALDLLRQLCRRHHWTLFDSQTGDLFAL